jgi:hypothetical protein
MHALSEIQHTDEGRVIFKLHISLIKNEDGGKMRTREAVG